jgi:RNA polymerase sigma factor (sigma-70 family)
MLSRQEIEFINAFIVRSLNSFYSKRVTASNRDDYTQEILIKVYIQYGRYDPDKGTLQQWVGRIIKNHIVDQERKNFPLNFYDDLSFHGEQDSAYNLEEDKLYQDRLTHLNGILDQETQENRDMINDFYINGLSNKEIADKYDQSEKSLAMRRKRIKEKVKKTFR